MAFAGIMPTMRTVYAILAAALLAAPVWGQSKPLETRETPVTRLMENIADTGFAVSPDSRHVAFPAKPSDRWAVYLDGKPGGFFAIVSEPVFALDSSRVLFGAQAKQGESWQIISASVDGAPVTEAKFDKIPLHAYNFSADSKRKAMVGMSGPKWQVTVDGVSQTFDAYFPETLAFSPDSQHVAWVAREGKETHAYIDGKPAGEPCAKAAALAWSGDSRRVAFRANTGKAYAATAGVAGVSPLPAGAMFDGLLEGPPALSRDGEHLTFGAVRNGKWLVVVDGKESKPYDGIGKDSIGFAGGKAVAIVSVAKKWRILEADVELPGDYDQWGTLVISVDGAHYAVATRAGAKWTVVVDGKPRPETYDQIGLTTVAFSPDGKQLAFAARRAAKWQVFREGVAVGGGYVALGAVPIAFSPDGTHIGFTAGKAGGKWVLVCDSRESKDFENFLRDSHPTFSADGQTLSTLAVSKANVLRVEAVVGK